MSTTRRTSADALLLMALGLGLLYHAGPWPWMSRTLTIVGAALPMLALSQAAGGSAAFAFLLGTLASAAIVLIVNITPSADAQDAYHIYALATVGAQAMLTATWVAWAYASRWDWLALLGTALAAIGAVMAAFVHLWIGQAAPPAPWTPWRTGDAGPVDMISRVAPWLVGPEGIMIMVAMLVWLWWGLRPRLLGSS